MVNKIKLSSGACILLAAMLILLPLRWVLAAILAAAFHEICHYGAIRILSGKPVSLQFYLTGGKMELPPMGHIKEILCSLAGPAGGLLLLLFARWLPRTAICAVFQSLYNLLPIYPMDGGRVLRRLTQLLLPPPAATAICRIIEISCCSALLLLGLYAWLCLHLGLTPLLLSLFLSLRLFFTKMPCKVSSLRVQ